MILVVTIFLHQILFSYGNLPPKWESNMNYQRIKEDTEIGTVVYTLNGTDTEGVQCVYGIIELGRPFFTVDPVSGNVSLIRSLDREMISQHEMTVSLSDGTNTVYEDIIILVEDANDNAPEFIGLPYTCDLPQTTQVNSKIFQITAEDPDLGPAGSVFYSMEWIDDKTDEFVIDQNNGWITLTKELTADMTGVHIVKIIAKDGGAKQLKSETTLAINIMTDHSQVLKVFENEPPHTLVGIINRIYTPFSGMTYYSIIDGNLNNTFNLFSVTRALHTTVELDREQFSTYHLTIAASSTPFKYDLHTQQIPDNYKRVVTIQVSDINDNPPIFETKNYLAGYSITSPIPSSKNNSIIQVSASDRDVNGNETNIYNILDHNPTPSFYVTPHDGIVYTTEQLGYQWRKGYFNLSVQVQDHLNESWRDTTNVIINIVTQFEEVKINFNGNDDQVAEKLDQFINLLADILDAKVIVDRIEEDKTTTDKDKSKTNLYLHVVDKITYFVVDNEKVISKIDASNNAIQKLLRDYNVISIEKPDTTNSYVEKKHEFFKAGMAATLSAALVVILVLSGLIYCIRKRYRTKLKAATAGAMSSNPAIVDGSFRKMSSEVLGTNKYSSEGGKYQPMYDDKDDDEEMNFQKIMLSSQLQFINPNSNVTTDVNWKDFYKLNKHADKMKFNEEKNVGSESVGTMESKLKGESGRNNNDWDFNENLFSDSDDDHLIFDPESVIQKKYYSRSYAQYNLKPNIAYKLAAGVKPLSRESLWKNSNWCHSKLLRRKQLQKMYNELNNLSGNQTQINTNSEFILKPSQNYGSLTKPKHEISKNKLKHFDLQHLAIGKRNANESKQILSNPMSNPVWNLTDKVPAPKLELSLDDVIVDVESDIILETSNTTQDLSLNEEFSEEVVESIFSRMTGSLPVVEQSGKDEKSSKSLKKNKTKKVKKNKKIKEVKKATKDKKKLKNDFTILNSKLSSDITDSSIVSDKQISDSSDVTMGRLHSGYESELKTQTPSTSVGK